MGGDCEHNPLADANRGLLLLLREPRFPAEPQNSPAPHKLLQLALTRFGKGRPITVPVLTVHKSWNGACLGCFRNSEGARSEFNRVSRRIWSVVSKLRKVGLTMSSVYIVLSVCVLCAFSTAVSSHWSNHSPFIYLAPFLSLSSSFWKVSVAVTSASHCTVFPSLGNCRIFSPLLPCAVPRIPTSLPPPNKSTTVPLCSQTFHSPPTANVTKNE